MTRVRYPFLVALCCFAGSASPLLADGTTWDQASLSLAKGDVVEVSAPLGAQRVRLEAFDDQTDEWETLVTGHLPDSTTGKLYLQIPRKLDRSQVRAKWSASAPFPYPFYEGRSRFSVREGDPSSASTQSRYTEVAFSEDAADTTDATDDGTENVEESDIWQLSGNKLYFFNQMRGLQVVDLSSPNNPEVIARHRLPASGEQMYLTEDGEHAYLLARKAGQDWPGSSEVRVLKLDDSEISEVARLDLDANYCESRMVGDFLYVLSEKWEQDKIAWRDWSFSYSTRLATFDLSDPDDPRKIDEKTLAGAPQVISATNSNLMVVTRDPSDYDNKHVVRVFDLTDFSGIPEEVAELQPGGLVLDKFKLRVRNSVLTVISQAYRDQDWGSRYSLLETFDLSTGERLGSLELADRETLHATRFDGDYAYVVTFLRIDPLFIIDLTDPREPSITSELEVDGWSEYIQPMGDQLFAVGVEEQQVTASLFDLTDKANPRLADRIYMGEEDAYSWSEANYDEKAIGQLSDQNVFLIPFQSWEDGESSNMVQILETTDTGITKLGTITHRFQARRAAANSSGLCIYSISENELQITDFAIREEPQPLARLPLAWKVDRLHPAGEDGEYILQIEEQGGYYWGWYSSSQDANATLRITTKEAPDDLIASLDLGPGTLSGSAVHEGKLHLARANQGKLLVDVYALEDDSAKRLASVETQLTDVSGNPKLKPFFLDDEKIIWITDGSQSSSYYPYEYLMDDVVDPYPNYGSGTVEAHSFVFEEGLSESTLTHEANASITLSGDDVQWGEPFLLEDRLIFGSTVTSHLYDSKQTWQVLASEVNASLHGFDLSDSENLTPLTPVSLPGLLVGLHAPEGSSRDAYLFTESKDAAIGYYGPMSISDAQSSYGHSLAVCAYDGSLAYYLDELEIDDDFSHLVVTQGNVFIGASDSSSQGVYGYHMDEEGLFAKTAEIFAGESLSELATDGSYLVGRTSDGVRVADLAQVEVPVEWPSSTLSGTLYPSIEDFVSSDDGIRIPSGNYGVELLTTPSTMERRALTARRSGTSDDWTMLEDSFLRVFKAEEVPVSLAHDTSPSWKFRPESNLDQNATSHEAHWKSLPWFGFFHARSYPWIYHTQLGWTYVSEDGDNALWLWREKSGWLWTRSDVYPYLFSEDKNAWTYLYQDESTQTVPLYNYSKKVWSTE